MFFAFEKEGQGKSVLINKCEKFTHNITKIEKNYNVRCIVSKDCVC